MASSYCRSLQAWTSPRESPFRGGRRFCEECLKGFPRTGEIVGIGAKNAEIQLTVRVCGIQLSRVESRDHADHNHSNGADCGFRRKKETWIFRREGSRICDKNATKPGEESSIGCGGFEARSSAWRRTAGDEQQDKPPRVGIKPGSILCEFGASENRALSAVEGCPDTITFGSAGTPGHNCPRPSQNWARAYSH